MLLLLPKCAFTSMIMEVVEGSVSETAPWWTLGGSKYFASMSFALTEEVGAWMT